MDMSAKVVLNIIVVKVKGSGKLDSEKVAIAMEPTITPMPLIR